jgi:hypothetical protein
MYMCNVPDGIQSQNLEHFICQHYQLSYKNVISPLAEFVEWWLTMWEVPRFNPIRDISFFGDKTWCTDSFYIGACTHYTPALSSMIP